MYSYVPDSPSWKTGEVAHALVAAAADVAVICVELMWKIGGMEGAGGEDTAAPEVGDAWSSQRGQGHSESIYADHVANTTLWQAFQSILLAMACLVAL